jgi:hypothetical protein
VFFLADNLQRISEDVLTLNMKNPRLSPFIDLACVLALVIAAGSLRAADDIPKRPAFDRYAAMMKKSPFAVATAVVAAAATPSFAKDLYVANAARTTDGDLVTIQSAIDRNLKEYLTTKGPNEHGYSISTIEWSEKPGQTKVTISKDGQFATLAFNQALMATAVPTNPQPPQPSGVFSAPGQPSVPAPAYLPPKPPPNAAGIPTPPPHTRGMIQRNPPPAQQQKPISDTSPNQ